MIHYIKHCHKLIYTSLPSIKNRRVVLLAKRAAGRPGGRHHHCMAQDDGLDGYASSSCCDFTGLYHFDSENIGNHYLHQTNLMISFGSTLIDFGHTKYRVGAPLGLQELQS
jgi:hypothetical protein